MSDTTKPNATALADVLAGLVVEATALAGQLTQAGGEGDAAMAGRLRDGVIRPLSHVLARAPGHGAPPHAQPPHAESSSASVPVRVWELATATTRLCLSPAVPVEVAQAAAGLQELACGLAPAEGPDGIAARVAQLWAFAPGLTPTIRLAPHGPYVVSDTANLFTHLGERLPSRPLLALCRCGESDSRPCCDGACARIGFDTDKDPNRVADQRDTYVGQQVTVFDNRGICQHSGYCTDRLASVFHLGQEPFVAPSGGRMDEIIRAVRDYPSGALSYALDTVEARGQVDHAGGREPAIEVSKDGPYRITGGIALVEGDGEGEGEGAEVTRNQGASTEHYALCRCGHSQNKPFCSGMHFYVGFADPVADPERTPSMFEWCGGLPALTRMTRLFYEKYVGRPAEGRGPPAAGRPRLLPDLRGAVVADRRPARGVPPGRRRAVERGGEDRDPGRCGRTRGDGRARGGREPAGAGVSTALLGKGAVDERSPWNTGAIGLLGTTASWHLMRECDTLLIVGSTMPYTEYYPAPGQARAVQIDVDGSRCGIRYDADVNLTGDGRRDARRPAAAAARADRPDLALPRRAVDALLERVLGAARPLPHVRPQPRARRSGALRPAPRRRAARRGLRDGDLVTPAISCCARASADRCRGRCCRWAAACPTRSRRRTPTRTARWSRSSATARCR